MSAIGKKQQNLRLSLEAKEKLEALARGAGISVSAVLEILIRQAAGISLTPIPIKVQEGR